MCGRYTLTTEFAALAKELGISPASLTDFSPRYNIAPSQKVPVFVFDQGPRLEFLTWGLIPPWVRQETHGAKMIINARGESLLTKPTFREPFRNGRCLIPADGFYEWLKAKKGAIPYYIRLKSREPFAFAGIWSTVANQKGQLIRSFAIITTEPNKVIKPIHNRMPAILSQAGREKWLDPNNKDQENLLSLLVPYPEEQMEAYQVGKQVNSPANDSPECIKKKD